jgi:cytoskeletal protein CcmA (bactofilin family)
MFFKKKGNGDDGTAKDKPVGAGATAFAEIPAEPSRPNPATALKPAGTGFNPELPRRQAEVPGAPRRTEPAKRADNESKRLIVGRDIILSGEITACDVLVVEGRVEATLSNSHAIELASTGHFKGSAEIDEADISGHFDGTITIRNRLMVRSTGKVTGTIRYGQIEIERGGEISGDVQLVSDPGKAKAG